MAVDRLSVTVPSEVGAALRALAGARGETVSTIVAEAIALRIRLAALDHALEEADRRFGSVGEPLIAEAEKELIRASKRRPGRGRKRSAA
jgi:predicted transcriptional regulator